MPRSHASIDAVSVRAKTGELTGRNPVDRGKPGSKYHLLVDANGQPLHVLLSAADTATSPVGHDVGPERTVSCCCALKPLIVSS